MCVPWNARTPTWRAPLCACAEMKHATSSAVRARAAKRQADIDKAQVRSARNLLAAALIHLLQETKDMLEATRIDAIRSRDEERSHTIDLRQAEVRSCCRRTAFLSRCEREPPGPGIGACVCVTRGHVLQRERTIAERKKKKEVRVR